MARGGKTDAPLVDAVSVDLASQLAAASGVGRFHFRCTAIRPTSAPADTCR